MALAVVSRPSGIAYFLYLLVVSPHALIIFSSNSFAAFTHTDTTPIENAIPQISRPMLIFLRLRRVPAISRLYFWCLTLCTSH